MVIPVTPKIYDPRRNGARAVGKGYWPNRERVLDNLCLNRTCYNISTMKFHNFKGSSRRREQIKHYNNNGGKGRRQRKTRASKKVPRTIKNRRIVNPNFFDK